MLQAGRIVNVHLPKDRVTQTHQGYGFVEFNSEEDAEYAARIMNQVRLYGKPIRVNKVRFRLIILSEARMHKLTRHQASADKQKPVEVGAELFIGGLDLLIDEKTLYDTFSRFGTLQSPPKIARDESGLSKGYGFVSYSTFEASDDAIANMNGQYLQNKEVAVQYAYKKDGKGERHGDEAERMLASQAKKHNMLPEAVQMPAQLLLNGNVPAGPAAMLDPNMGMNVPPPSFPPGFGGRGPPPGANYNNVPPPQQRQNGPPPHLPTAPSGLPQRPPPSQAGYGGPQEYMPPGFGGQQQGGMPPGFGAPPPGFPMAPPGFAPPPMQQQAPPGYGGRR